jgi:outer membrane protein assembly factor BamB
VFVSTGDGWLVAYDAAGGVERWRIELSETGGAVGSAALDDGVLYVVAEGGGLRALDATNGTEHWRYDRDAAITGTAVVADGMVYVSSASATDGTLRALDAQTGAERWNAPGRLFTPAVSGGVAYSGSETGIVAAHGTSTGAELWRLSLDGKARTPAIFDDTLIVAGEQAHRVYALDATTGAERWRFDVDGAASCCVAVARGMAFVATTLGSVYAIGGSENVQTGVARQQAASPDPTVVPDPTSGQPEAAAALTFVWESHGGSDPFRGPSDLAFDHKGQLWVADSATNGFQLLDTDGIFLEAWGSTGSGPGQFRFTLADGGVGGDVAFDSDGNAYVLDIGNRRVQVFDPERHFVREWGTFGSENGQFVSPYGITIDADGSIYVSDYGREDVQKFAPDGTWLLTFGGHGSGDGQLSFQAGVNAAPDGTIWVGDFGNARVQQFTSDGEYLTQWSGGELEDERLKGPGVAVADADGWLYVADTVGHKVVVRSPAGELAAIVGEQGTEPGQFGDPVGIALDGAGGIYVSDASLGRVQKFMLAGD